MKKKFKGLLVMTFAVMTQLIFAQERAISGVVSDANGPIPGANVVLKGTKAGVQTDFDGKYTIKAKTGDVLTFSYVGMKDANVTIGASSSMNVKMQDVGQELQEVVVTAMGVKKSTRVIAYATQEVKAADITRGNNNSLSGALQGKLSGVQITPSSGAPGASSQIVIRGARSFTGNNSPLYVIDGMPVASQPDFSTGNGVTGSDIANRAVDIDPNEIESINVLKGQAASALYGLRASNGVIVITTKSGKNAAKGKPVISFNTSTSFETISKKPDTQNEYAQGSNGKFNPNASTNWGPKISELPNDPTYGGNVANALNGGILKPGKYYVPQRAKAGLDPWVSPRAYNNIDDFFHTGFTINNSLNISQSTEKTNYSFGVGTSKQDGIIPETGMNRYTAKAVVDTKLNNEWKTGFSFNYIQTKINKSTSANDGAIVGVFAAPRSYDLKGIGYANPSNQYDQIYYRPSVFNNPYWAAHNNEFSEKTNRAFGNTYIQYSPIISAEGNQKLTVKYQVGVDSWTTNYRNIFEFGNKLDLSGQSSSAHLFGTTNDVINSLFTLNYNLNITKDLNLNALVGNEYNHQNTKEYDEVGSAFNFGGWPTIANARTITAEEYRRQIRTVGFFSNIELSFRNMLFLSGTIRKDIASNMPRGNRDFIYPSASLGFVITELEGLKENSFLSYAKLRGSIAQVGQAGNYVGNYYTSPSYSGGFWSGQPIQYPLGGISSYIPNNVQYDPNLKPQNTKSYELGVDLKFFKNRIGIDYTFSKQNSTNQIFSVPLAGSTGASSLVTNGGKMRNDVHEITLIVNPVHTKDFNWTFNVNFSKIDSYVEALSNGVDNIFLGGFVTPQLRASVGDRFPVIYGTGFARDTQNNIIVNSQGLPMADGELKVLGEVAPKFTIGGSTQFTYKRVSLGAVVDWKNGGKIYSGSNNLMSYYGVDARTADRTSEFVFPGVKEDGTPNDIVRGGASDSNAYQQLQAALNGIAESAVFDASFVKLREVTLGYQFPKLLNNTVDLRASIFARNILLWSKMPNLDPEATQGNNNFSGGFEQWSMPQTKSIGFGINFTF